MYLSETLLKNKVMRLYNYLAFYMDTFMSLESPLEIKYIRVQEISIGIEGLCLLSKVVQIEATTILTLMRSGKPKHMCTSSSTYFVKVVE